MMLKKTPALKTKRLMLGEIKAGDRADVMRILFNEKVKQTYMIPDYESEEQAMPLFERLGEFSRSQTRFVYGVFLEERLIGFWNDCGIEGSEIELGYVIHPDYWGQGYATEVLDAVIRELFRMGYTRVKAGHFVENPASGRVMEKCGMRKLEETSDITYRGAVHRCINYEAVPSDVG